MNMKKSAFAILACMAMITGCSNTSVTKNDNGEAILASLDGMEMTAESFYEEVMTSENGEYIIFETALNKLIDKVAPVTEAMEKTADIQIDNIKANYSYQYGDTAETQLESDLAMSGYNSIDEFRNNGLIRQLQRVEFLLKYVDENYDEVFADYMKVSSPRLLSVIFVSAADPTNPTEEESDKLKEVEALLKTDKDFGKIAQDYSDDGTTSVNKGKLGIVDSSTDLSSSYGSDAQVAALALKQGKVSKTITGTNGFYIFKCTSTKADDIKAELATMDINTPLVSYDSYMVYLAFNSYDLTFDDEKVEAAIKHIVDEALDLRDSNRKGE